MKSHAGRHHWLIAAIVALIALLTLSEAAGRAQFSPAASPLPCAGR
jgi:hypothetical protein